MLYTRLYLKVSELRPGDMLSFDDQGYRRGDAWDSSELADHAVVSGVRYDNGYWIDYANGEVSGPYVTLPYSRYAYRPIPDGVLNWSDDAFAEAQAVSCRVLPDNSAVTAAILAGSHQTIGEERYYPVYVTGHFGDVIFTNWPGVGPSPSSYKMKAFVNSAGRLYYSDGSRDNGSYRKPVAVNTDWVLPYIKAMQ